MGDAPATLDPNDYVILPDVAVIDEFHLVRPHQNAVIDARFLQEICDTATRREGETGDYCPVVIGHRILKPGVPETEQPRVVGYARNWKVAPLFNTGRMACKPDLWIKKPYYHTVKDYPRRSAELWVHRREVDPISLLGSTVPHRDLGLLPVALNRTGSADETPVTIDHDLGPLPVALNRDPADPPVSVIPTQEPCPMPNETKPDAPKADPNDKGAKTPGNAEIVELLHQIVAMLSGGAKPAGPEAGATTGESAGGEDDMSDMSDEEFMRLLEQAGGGKAAEEPVQNGFAYPGPTNTSNRDMAQLQREIEAVRESNLKLVTQLARRDLQTQFDEFKKRGIKIEDEAGWIDDLIAMPEDRRVAQLARLAKLPAAPVGVGLLGAVRDAVSVEAGVPGKDRGCTEEESKLVAQLARQEGLSYQAAHRKKFGYYPFGHQDNKNAVPG